MLFQGSMFRVINKDGKARAGILKTAHGQVETPFFMPVATKTAVKYLDARDLEEMGIQAIIANAFVLSLRPGIKIIKKAVCSCVNCIYYLSWRTNTHQISWLVFWKMLYLCINHLVCFLFWLSNG